MIQIPGLNLSELKPLAVYEQLSKVPYGKQIFSKFVSMQAPYFATIDPLITELRPNYAEVQMKKKRSVENHIRTVHAIAMCNLAEVAGGMLTEVTVPDTHRWIPKGMTVEYVKKAHTDLVGIATPVAPMNTAEASDFKVNVDVLDKSRELVFRAVLTLWVSPKKKSS